MATRVCRRAEGGRGATRPPLAHQPSNAGTCCRVSPAPDASDSHSSHRSELAPTGAGSRSSNCWSAHSRGMGPFAQGLSTPIGVFSWHPSRPISRVLSPRSWIGHDPRSGQRSSIWDDGCPPPLAAYPGLGRDGPPRARRSGLRPCLALLPVGVAWPPVSPRAPVVSYTTFSPSPQQRKLPRSLGCVGCLLFCGPLPSGHPA